MLTIATILLLITILFLYLKNKDNKKVEYVYINEKSKKYHFEECPYAKNLKGVTLKDAVKNGYTPCKICNHNQLQ